jgi:hypothetical protein
MIKLNVLLIVIFLANCLYSCQSKNQPLKTEKYYLLYENRGNSVDTFSYDSINKYQPGSINHNVLDSFDFVYKGRYIKIKKVSNYPNELIDGGFVTYWEKSIGYFYQRSTTWRTFGVLKTTNDSLNDFISVLLATVLLDPQFSTNPGVDYKNFINFTKPIVSDTIK